MKENHITETAAGAHSPKHPAVPNLPRKYRGGANGMRAGDRVLYKIDGRCGVADEFLSDGDAFISWDDGTFGTVKWHHLQKSP